MDKYARWEVTPAHHRFIAANQAHISRSELTAIINKRFGLALSVERVASYTKRNGMTRIITPLINDPKQKQWIAEHHGSMPRTHLTNQFNAQFGTNITLGNMRAHCRRHKLKMAELRRNYLPLGYISRHGKFWRIKTANPDTWQRLHRYVYEKEYGAIPEGFCIMFADGDGDNVDIENLVCVPASASFVINKDDNRKTEIPELNRAAMLTTSLNVLSKDK